MQQSSSPSPINHAFHSIKWAHNIASMSFATDSDFVKNILEGAKRRLSLEIFSKMALNTITSNPENYLFLLNSI